MKRTRLTIVTAVCLLATYRVYAQWIDQITAVESPPTESHSDATDAQPNQPPVFATFTKTARSALPDDDWIEHAKFRFQRGDGLVLYAQEIDLVEEPDGSTDAGQVEFRPLVVVSLDRDDPSRRSYVMKCESARVRFENPFRLDLDAGSPGRLIAAALDGPVLIDGPDGLHLEGRNFVFSEESRHLYSDYPVHFAYGPEPDSQDQFRGSADAIQIDFEQGTASRGDLPQIGGIERIQLRRNLVLDFTFEDDDTSELVTTQVRSDGICEYRVAERIATLEDNVVVEHPTVDKHGRAAMDRLHCDWLAMLFEPAEVVADDLEVNDLEDKFAQAFQNLKFRKLRAQGQRATLRSDRMRLTASMEELQYDAASREVTLIDHESVRVQREQQRLFAPRVTVWHDESGELDSFACHGAGLLERRSETDDLFQVSWEESLTAMPDRDGELLKVQLDGRAKAVQVDRHGLLADHIVLWVDREKFDQLTNEDSDARENGVPVEMIRSLAANGDVQIASRRYRFHTDQFEATMRAKAPAPTTTAAGLAPDRDTANHEGDDDENPPWIARADSVSVTVAVDSETREIEVETVTADGGVLLQRAAADATDEPVSISGEHVRIDVQGPDSADVQLSGGPAHLRRGQVHLEGSDIRYESATEVARVVGQGMLQVPVPDEVRKQFLSQDAAESSAPAADRPLILDVHWHAGMTFDGIQAKFLEQVALKLEDSRLYCEDMSVRLSQPVRFSTSDSSDAEIASIACREGVRIEVYEWADARLSGIRKAEFAEFTFDNASGDFYGMGPGVINDWTRGDRRRVTIAPQAVAQANQPVKEDRLEWEYANLRFADRMTGNSLQRVLVLDGRVRVMYAPVEHALETFSRDELSGDSPSVEHAVWLGCDKLSVSLHPWPEQDGDFAMIGARGRCELEGELFRAVADMLSYDQSAKLFTLKGEGGRDASIYYQEYPGAEPRHLPAKVLEFVPSRKRVRARGTSGIGLQ